MMKLIRNKIVAKFCHLRQQMEQQILAGSEILHILSVSKRSGRTKFRDQMVFAYSFKVSLLIKEFPKAVCCHIY